MMEIPKLIKDHKYAVIDTETTGYNWKRDEIIQVGIIQVDYGKPRFRLLVQCLPRGQIGEGAQRVHGINKDQLSHSPRFEEIAQELLDFIGDRCALGYNIRAFDARILTRQFGDAGVQHEQNTSVLDVYAFSRKSHDGLHKLKDEVEHYKLPFNQFHNALDDCRATWGVFSKMLQQFPKLGDMSLEEALAVQESRSHKVWL